MKIFLVLILILVCKNHSFFKEFIIKLRKSVTWEVQELEENIFKIFKDKDLKKLLGEHTYKEDSIYKVSREDFNIKGHPENFDGRDKWKTCILKIKGHVEAAGLILWWKLYQIYFASLGRMLSSPHKIRFPVINQIMHAKGDS